MQPQAGPAVPDISYQPITQRPTRKRYMVMIFIGTLAFLTYFDRVCIAWAGEYLTRDLHLTDQQMGLILGVFWFAYALFEIPGGWLADRYGARKALTRIVLAWSVFTALSGAATGFYSLFLYRFMFGVGEAGAFPAMAKVQSRWLPVQSRAWFGGILWMLSRWGGAFSPVIFGGMMKGFESPVFKKFASSTPGLHWLATMPSWRLGFWAAGLLGVIWVSFFFPWFRDEPDQKKSVNHAEINLIKAGREARDEVHHHDAHVLKWLFASKSMWIVAGIGVLVSYCFSFWVSWLPKYLKDVQGVDLKKNLWLGVLPMLFMGLSCLITGRLSDWFVRITGRKHLGRAIFPVTGLLLSAAAVLTLRLAQTPTQAIILLCIAAYCVDMNQACHWANIVDIGGRYAAMAFGFMNMIGNIGNSVAPVTNERLFNLYGWNALFTVNAIILCSATIFWFFNDPNKRFYPEHAAPQGFEPIMPFSPLDCPKCKQILPGPTSTCPFCGYTLIPPRP
ncbi:MAG TPA: MFS transporter [Tepidisphaeraceae bacterium]|nr:MFS transporter [Tepidisphaeraceae bacterium]